MARTPKKARKHATQPIPTLEAPPPTVRPRRSTVPITLPSPRIEQPLDTPDLEGGTLLADIRARWKAGGSLLPQPTESERLLIAYKKAHDAVENARKVLHDALAVEGGTILDLARAFGGNSLRIGGVVHDFACRGETIFFRRKNVGIVDMDTTTQDK